MPSVYVLASLVPCLALAAPCASATARPRQPGHGVRVTVDFGADVGQNFGTLFEARDAAGRTVFGAGFPGVYNTMFRANRRTLQVFVKPASPTRRPAAFRKLPRSTTDSGVYLYDFATRLWAFPYTAERIVRAYDPNAAAWRAEAAGAEKRAWGFCEMELGDGVLRMARDHVEFGGQVVLGKPERGSYSFFYYALGHIICYWTDPAEAGGFTEVVAFPWRPGDGPVRTERAVRVRTRFAGEAPFAYGQLRGEVLTCSNRGGIYVFDGRRWRVLQASLDKGSYQIYSMLNYRDRLLMAHYPSGELYEYDGKTIRHKPGWPPSLPGVSTSAREAQTMGLYSGDLWVGVWPWGTVWRYEPDADRWHFAGRTFTRPALTDKVVHPYEVEATAAGLTLNDWGQRVTGMVALGDALYLSTSSKGAWAAPSYDWLPPESLGEYGRVLEIREPGNLAAYPRWRKGATTIEVRFGRTSVSLWQDAALLASADLPAGAYERIAAARLYWGRGLFGPFAGRILTHHVW